MPYFRNQRGVTLLELLIYVAILAIVSVVVVGTFVTIGRGRGAIEAKTEVTSNLRFALQRLTQDLRVADTLVNPGIVGASSSILVMTTGADTITYDVVDGQLRRQLNTDSPLAVTAETVEIIAAEGSPVSFVHLGNTNAVGYVANSLEISLTMRYRTENPEWQYEETKKTTVVLR